MVVGSEATTEDSARGSDGVQHALETIDGVFLLTVVMEAIRRGVIHRRLDGTPLDRVEEVLNALVEDGEVFLDAKNAEEAPRQ